MKGGGYLYEWRTKQQLCFLFIFVVCTTFIVWCWGFPSQLFIHPAAADGEVKFRQSKDESVVDSAASVNVAAAAPPSSLYIQSDNKYSNREEIVAPEVEPKKQEKQVCSFGKGKWVRDDEWPLYSGFGCKQWLSSMWACRLTQRTDFSYEKLRWQPTTDCNFSSFSGPRFLKKMQDKTLAFIGDSLGRQQFQSLMCMITAGEDRHDDVQDVGKEYGLVKARGSVRPDGWAYRFPITNTTILYYWSASLCKLEPIDNSSYIAMHLDRPPAFLQRFIGRFNVVVLNTGHHWNRGKLNANRWVMYVDGKPNNNKDISKAKNLTIHSIVNWANAELHHHNKWKRGLKVFYRSISPRHFFNGDWNTGGTCDSSTPGSLEVNKSSSSSDYIMASGAVEGTDVKLLDITGLSEVRDEGHISRYGTPGMQDCLHWCLPGIPDTWNHLLFAQI